MSAKFYWQKMREILAHIEEEEWPQIQKTAGIVADVTMRGDMVHVFGPGHTHTIVDEMWMRAGGLASINPIHDANMMPAFGPLKGSALENLEGYGRVLFNTHNVKTGEVMLLVSNVGTLPIVVDVGLATKEAGLTLVTLASLDFSKSARPRHSSGKKLYEIADIVIDNKCPPGEAAIEMEGLDRRVGPATMIANAWILNAIVAEAAALIAGQGLVPPVFVNFNVELPQEQLYASMEELVKPYRPRLAVMDFHKPSEK